MISIPLPDFDSLWNYADPAETERQFRALLPRAEASGDESYTLQLLSQIARTQGLQRQFAAAHETLNGVERRLPPAASLTRVRYLLERGRVFNSSGQPDSARPLFLDAWAQAQALGVDAYAIDAAHMVAIVAPPAEQLAWNLQALALAERTLDPQAAKWRGSLYNNLGWTYHAAGQFAEALTMFERALAYRESQGQANAIHIARWCVARCLRSLGRVEEALIQQQALLTDNERLGEKDGYVLEELGECLLALNRPAYAQPYFAAAYEELSKDVPLIEGEPKRLERLKQLGRGKIKA